MNQETIGGATLYLGDCLDVMRGMADNSVDSIVTDPPYGLSDHTEKDIVACMTAWLAGKPYLHGKAGFMNRTWDSFVPGPEVWREAFRVLKPGGYVLCFASTRTDDLMSMALRLAGFRKHPFIGWVFGSGFPKAANLGKAFDKDAGADREVLGVAYKAKSMAGGAYGSDRSERSDNDVLKTNPATDAAKQWDGWYYGLQSLKPAIEPCLMFQKPHQGRMTNNVEKFGTGAVNIDGCRVGTASDADAKGYADKCASVVGLSSNCNGAAYSEWSGERQDSASPMGRWPENLITDGSAEVVALFPNSAGAGGSVPNVKVTGYGSGIGTGASDYLGGARTKVDSGAGSAARFFKQAGYDDEDVEVAQQLFYCAKASRKDRNEGLPNGDERAVGTNATMRDCEGADWALRNGNHHPTVKPTDLMRYLLRLVTPPGGIPFDPFMGSGSTGKAAMLKGFGFVGIERDAEYLAIARARISNAQRNPENEKQALIGQAPALTDNEQLTLWNEKAVA